MSIFSKIGKGIKKVVKKVNDVTGDIAGGVINKVTGNKPEREKRSEARAIGEQIQAYKDQTALAAKEVETARAEKDVQKRKINEKQIRSLRNNFRPSGGFLNNQAGADTLTSKLGA
jgi:hypothetical protein